MKKASSANIMKRVGGRSSKYHVWMKGAFAAIILLQITQMSKIANSHFVERTVHTHDAEYIDVVHSEDDSNDVQKPAFASIDLENMSSSNNHPEVKNVNNPFTVMSRHSLFHLIFTTAPETLNWRVVKSIESVFYHHPRAKVIIHSNTLPANSSFPLLENFTLANYDLEVKPYSFEELLEKSEYVNSRDMDDFIRILEKRRSSKFWYSHETDLIRLLLLEQNGGVYIDTDIHFIKPIPADYNNLLGFQGRAGDKVNGAVMIFERHNPFLRDCLKDAISIAIHSYTQRDWEIFGPRLLTRHFEERRNETEIIRAVEMNTFYPYPIYRTKQCFTAPKEEFNPVNYERTVAVHLNTGLTKEYNYTMIGTVCEEIFKSNCIFCSDNSYLRKSVQDD